MKEHPHGAHRITITPHRGRVTVRFAGAILAESSTALRLEEAGYPAVYYLPRDDVRAAALRASTRTSHCPFKGEASYWSLAAGERESVDAAWSYEQPLAGVAAIAGHLAFHGDRVDSIDVD